LADFIIENQSSFMLDYPISIQKVFYFYVFNLLNFLFHLITTALFHVTKVQSDATFLRRWHLQWQHLMKS